MQCPALQSTSLGRAHRSAPLSLGKRITSGSSRWCSSLRQQWHHQQQECPQPTQPVVVAAASASAAPLPSSGPSSLNGLGVLRTAKPVDRLRYQAKIVFEHFDGDKDGRLNASELSAYLAYAAAKLPVDSAELSKLQQDAAAVAAAGRALDIEAFDDLFRAQIKTCSASSVALPFLKATLTAGPNEVPRLQYKTSLSPPELAACLATFRLLDLNGDNYVALADLKAVGGIERDIAEDVLEEADANGDGFLTFEDFLASYAREKPIILNMLVLAAHSAFFWFVLNSPLDIMLRVVVCGVALLRPQIITNPTIKLFNIISSIVLRARAEIFMAQQRKA